MRYRVSETPFLISPRGEKMEAPFPVGGPSVKNPAGGGI